MKSSGQTFRNERLFLHPLRILLPVFQRTYSIFLFEDCAEIIGVAKPQPLGNHSQGKLCVFQKALGQTDFVIVQVGDVGGACTGFKTFHKVGRGEPCLCGHFLHRRVFV